ncbi:UPF0047 protein YjbQ-like [Littorina saxatilis]|uniref:Uncharacterized protein n=2 Tax=Littorina saxatilis TaxID=31220 RepID=A0AAN9GK40_9CAEN
MQIKVIFLFIKLYIVFWLSFAAENFFEEKHHREESCSRTSMSGGQSVWYQKEVALPSKKRGCHLVTDDLTQNVPEIEHIKVGLAHVHIKHTSASLALNENWDPDVRVDTEMMLNKIVPEGQNYLHSCEGPDDMPAHIKAALIGSSVTIPITDGKFNLGTWQGVWLCEHRNHGGSRKVVVTVQGAKK